MFGSMIVVNEGSLNMVFTMLNRDRILVIADAPNLLWKDSS